MSCRVLYAHRKNRSLVQRVIHHTAYRNGKAMRIPISISQAPRASSSSATNTLSATDTRKATSTPNTTATLVVGKYHSQGVPCMLCGEFTATGRDLYCCSVCRGPAVLRGELQMRSASHESASARIRQNAMKQALCREWCMPEADFKSTVLRHVADVCTRQVGVTVHEHQLFVLLWFSELHGISTEQAKVLLQHVYDRCPEHRNMRRGKPCLKPVFQNVLLRLTVDALLVGDITARADFQEWAVLDDSDGCEVWQTTLDMQAAMRDLTLAQMRDTWNTPEARHKRVGRYLMR